MTECTCGSHNTDVVIQWHEYEYKGHVQQVECSYIECWDCGLEFQIPKQINDYARQVREAKVVIDQWILDNEGE